MPDADPSLSDDDPSLTYAAAMGELDAILRDLDDEALDVDVVATKVARAAELVRVCRARIRRAGDAVERVVAELDGAEALEPDDADS